VSLLSAVAATGDGGLVEDKVTYAAGKGILLDLVGKDTVNTEGRQGIFVGIRT
jgi:hypothetical protein